MRARDVLSWRVLFHLLVIRPFLKLFFGVNVAGRENLEGLDRFILASNHNSHLDVFLLFHVVPVGRIAATRPVAAEEYFSRSRLLYGLLDRLLRPVWVRRGGDPAAALSSMGEVLDRGGSLIVFPEGTRGEPGRIAAFRTGIGRLAETHPDVPVVPVFLSGPERAFPKASAVPLPIWNSVTIGPPRLYTGGFQETTGHLERAIRELAASEEGRRHRRAAHRPEVRVVAVLGIDGSGKSTLSGRLAEELSREQPVCRIGDGLEFYDAGRPRPVRTLVAERLRERLGARTKRARTLVSYKIPKLVELLLRDRLLREATRWYAPGVVVQDGSPPLNLAAWAMIYRSERMDARACSTGLRIVTGERGAVPRRDPVYQDFPELAAIAGLGLTGMRMPDALILLDVEPAVAIERIVRRGGERQAHETEERLAALRAGYRLVCDVVRGEFTVPCLVIGGDEGIERATERAAVFVRGVLAAESADA